jgi:hypothetical protein
MPAHFFTHANFHCQDHSVKNPGWVFPCAQCALSVAKGVTWNLCHSSAVGVGIGGAFSKACGVLAAAARLRAETAMPRLVTKKIAGQSVFLQGIEFKVKSKIFRKKTKGWVGFCRIGKRVLQLLRFFRFLFNLLTFLEGSWGMNEQIWYLYQNGQQMGPFESSQIVQLFTSNMIAQESYVFKVGWKEWRPVEDCYDELGIPKPESLHLSESSDLAEKRANAPRATITGSVIVHNNGQLCIGNGVNISATGIFVETGDQIFDIGETLNLTVRCEGLGKPFNVRAKVIRFSSEPPYPAGYGLQFQNLAHDIKDRIVEAIKEQNLKENKVASTFV